MKKNSTNASKTAHTAVIYCRTSSDESTDPTRGRESIDQQEAECRALAVRLGYTAAEVYIDRDYSGRTYWQGCPVASLDRATAGYLDSHGVRESKRQRPALARLIAALPSVDAVICRDLTRLARPVPDSMLGQAVRQALGSVTVITVADGVVDSKSFAQRLASLIVEVSEDHKISQTLEASKASLKRIRDSGGLYHCPSFYGFASRGKQRVLAIPDQLATVRRVFDLALAGNSIMGICRTLNADNTPTHRSGNGKSYPWTFRQIQKMLLRPAYAGYQTASDGSLVASPIFQPHAVVSLSEFQTIKARLSDGKKYVRTTGKVHPLSGLLICGNCGHHLVAYSATDFDKRTTRNHYYRCQNSLCQTSKQRADCRYSLVRETLSGNPYGVGLLDALMPLCGVGYHQELASRQAEGELADKQAALKRQLDQIAKEEKLIYNDSLTGVIDESLKAGLLSERRESRKQIEADLAEIADKIAKSSVPLAETSRFILSLTGGGLDPETYRRLIHQAVESITVHPYSVTVKLASRQSFNLPRIPDRNARILPRVGVTLAKPMDINSRLEVCYLYKSAYGSPDMSKLPSHTLLDTPDLRIVALGDNPTPYGGSRVSKKGLSVASE